MARPNVLDSAAAVLGQVSQRPVRGYATFEFGRERHPGCRSVIVPEAKAKPLVYELREHLPAGLVSFIGTTNWLGKERPNGAEVVVGKGKSRFDMLRLARCDACNYDPATEDIIRKLQSYDRDFGINLFHVETDTIEFDLVRLPAKLTAFAEDLYEFCPDIVEQGVGTVAALVRSIKTSRKVFLWWD